jgi:light-regulated signal transduction histidine kinase (bacteriophytochrome)
MTRQKMLEESLANLNSQLEQRIAERTHQLEATVKELRRKNEEVEAFVYTVSHDLRAPLVNVQGFARELEESCASLKSKLALWDLPAREREAVQVILDEDIAGALRFISASSAKFERLIDALLGLSRHGRQVYRMVQVDVQELVVSTMATLQQLIAEAGASIRVGKLPPVTADMTALGQVFSNLIGNCLKYRSPLRPLEVEVGGEVDGEGVRYWVRDNGLGIPESGKAKLFQVFLRLHPKQAAGEGMGLAIVHRIVERHGGKIWAESQDGQGTTFFFFMPAEPDGAAAAGEEELSNEP